MSDNWLIACVQCAGVHRHVLSIRKDFHAEATAQSLSGCAAFDDYQVTPGYELLILGSYPNSRFFSVTVYDSHAAVTSNTIDTEILPLNSSMFNPFLTSAPYQPNQQYGITVGFGGAPLGAVAPGCGTSVTTIDSNFLDASQTHPGITWDGYPDLPAGYLFAPLSSSLVESITKGQEFIRLQFPLPLIPTRLVMGAVAVSPAWSRCATPAFPSKMQKPPRTHRSKTPTWSRMRLATSR